MDLETFISRYQRSLPRYRGLAFSASSISVISEVRDRLQRYLAPVDLWRMPGDGVSPTRPITKSDFHQEVFDRPHPDGLIICFPEEWMVEWPDPERDLFWCSLSETFGANWIYSLIGETPLGVQHISRHFHRTSLENGAVTAWTSRHGRGF